MSDVFLVIGLVSVAALFGSMAFFSGVVAPLTLIKLDEATAARFVRSIFPWYYVVIAGFSLIAAAALVATRPVEAAIMGMIAFGAVFARQILVPRINACRDRMVQDDTESGNAFARLHRVSVWINGVPLIGTLTVLVLIGMA